MEKMLFVLNPIAGGGRAINLEQEIIEIMDRYSTDYEIILTTRPGEAIEIVENSNVETVVAVGGDGTVNEFTKGILKRGFGVLGIIPGGTGNDLSRSLNIPRDTKEALEFIMNNEAGDIDVCKANGHYFLNIASIGFDAEVVNNASKIKHIIKGSPAYFLSILYTFLVYRNKDVSLDLDGTEIDANMVLLAVGNGHYYGGGVYIMPQSKPSDGYLHTIFVKDVGRLKLMALFPTIFKGKHIEITKYVDLYKAKKIVLRSKKRVFFNLDGEILDGGHEIVFEITDKKMPIYYPVDEE